MKAWNENENEANLEEANENYRRNMKKIEEAKLKRKWNENDWRNDETGEIIIRRDIEMTRNVKIISDSNENIEMEKLKTLKKVMKRNVRKANVNEMKLMKRK